jgi:DNA-binding CsgD family transcriptional regulator
MRWENGRVGAIVGREAELAALDHLLDDVDGGPATLALWGEAGIGKSTIWQAGVAAGRERGYAVLASRPAASEVRLTYAGLDDLLVDVDAGVIEALPGPQRRAIDIALLRQVGDQHALELRAVAAGLLSVLNTVAAAAPVLVAVDDLQWLDEPSRRVVAFAVRRCRGPVAMLSAERREQQAGRAAELCPRDLDRLRQLRVPPLSLGALHHVVREGTGRSLPRPTMVRVAELSGGNPFFALELARTVNVGDSRPAGFPSSLHQVVQAHVTSLAAPVRDALLVASAVGEAPLQLVGRACGVGDVVALLAPAEEVGVVEVRGGRVRFTHPLLAAAVYSEASPVRRRALHRTLSGLVDGVEERARHLALAATSDDADTVRALDAAARHARGRGAASAAAELLELAIGLGASDPRRRVLAARDHFDAGDLRRARMLLEAAISDLDAGPLRAEALGLLGAVLYEVEGYGQAIDVLERALGEAGAEARLRSSIALELCMALPNSGRLLAAIEYAKVAVEAAESVGDDGLLAEALGESVMVRFLVGDGVDEASLERALALEDPERLTHAVRWPSLNAAMVHLWGHQVDRARVELAALYERCLERGAESDLWFVLAYATQAALWCGDVEAAERLASEMTERAGMTGGEPVAALALTVRATVDAWRGRVNEARAGAEAAVAGLVRSQFGGGWLFALGARGAAELSVGDHVAAARWLTPAAMHMLAIGVNEPSFAPFLPDAAEVLVALGRLDEAEPLVERLEASGRTPGHAWAEAVGARCRGLLLAATGRIDEALVAFERALAAHDRDPLRYDKARTLLLLGQLQRRQNQRRAAKTSLEGAARLFDDVGAAQWATTAWAELNRLGLHRGRSDQLTSTEERIADLAAAGMTNREVATKLFISPKTVEANLSRAYRKLGVRSRAELGRWRAERSR